MSEGSLHLSVSAVDRIFPFHLRWSKEGKVRSLGSRLASYWDLAADCLLDRQDIRLLRPFPAKIDHRLFSELTHMAVDLYPADRRRRIIRGEFIDLEDEQGWLFIGFPLLSTVSELHESDLMLGDLPKHLGLGDLLIANEAAAVAQKNSEEVSEKLLLKNQQLGQSLREKEILLQEIHHRVKNNLQIISSLLMLQANKMQTTGTQNILKESVLRVRSMALIHQQLYGVESLSTIDFADYARSLARSLISTLSPSAQIKIDASTVMLTVERAVPLGLILNELVTNALKYGVPADDTPGSGPGGRRANAAGDVIIAISGSDEMVHLSVSDCGPGLPDDFDPARSTGLGMQLVHALTRQVQGRLRFEVDSGTRFLLECPLGDEMQ